MIMTCCIHPVKEPMFQVFSTQLLFMLHSPLLLHHFLMACIKAGFGWQWTQHFNPLKFFNEPKTMHRLRNNLDSQILLLSLPHSFQCGRYWPTHPLFPVELAVFHLSLSMRTLFISIEQPSASWVIRVDTHFIRQIILPNGFGQSYLLDKLESSSTAYFLVTTMPPLIGINSSSSIVFDLN